VEDACEETYTEDEEEEEVVEKGQARVGAEDEAGDGDASEKVASSAKFSFCYDKEHAKKCYKKDCPILSRSCLGLKHLTAHANVNSILFNLYFCEALMDKSATEVESKGFKRVKAVTKWADTFKLVCNLPKVFQGACSFLTCNRNAVLQFTDTCLFNDMYLTCKKYPGKFYGRS
jgi:hypothetical protein